MGFVVYAEVARSLSFCAAAWMLADAFARVCSVGEPGGIGRGGGARSGSELSHLRLEKRLVSPMLSQSKPESWPEDGCTYIGIARLDNLPASDMEC